MAYNENSLGVTQASGASHKAAFAEVVQPKTFAAGSGTLATLYPVAYNTSTNKWVPLAAGTDEVTTLSPAPVRALWCDSWQIGNFDAEATGTFTITVNDEETANIAVGADSATVIAALRALETWGGSGGSITGSTLIGSAMTITINGGGFQGIATTVTIDTTNVVTPGSPICNHARTLTGGTFTITVGGVETADIDADATASEVQAAILALTNVFPGEITVTGGPLHKADLVLTWKGQQGDKDITVAVDSTDLTDGNTPTITVTETTKGAVGANGTGSIKGFVWPDPITLDSDEEVVGQVMMVGKVAYSDIVRPSTIAEVDFKAILKRDCRAIGIDVQGLPADEN